MRVLPIILLLSAGCAAWYAPSEEQFREAEAKNAFGPVPDANAVIGGYLHANLKDPYSVRDFAVGPLEKTYIITGQDFWGHRIYYWCYRCGVQYNAKNSFGAYVGLRGYVYYLRADSGVVRVE